MLGLLVFGYLFLVYGLLKYFLCFLEIVLTYDQRTYLLQKIPLLRNILTTDVSTAGRTLSIIYIVFAVITIFRAVERIQSGTVHSDVIEIINERIFIYVIYSILGLLLVTLYLIIIYSNISIEKNIKYEKRYKLMGICGGLTFIASVPILYMFHRVFDNGLMNTIKYNFVMLIFSLMVSVAIISFIFYIGYTVVKNDSICGKKKVSFHEILTLFIIPTNII